MTEQELMYASEEDIAFFEQCIFGLPSTTGIAANGEPIPYSCGAHSVRCLRTISEYVKPKAILEIGFNVGYSASLWLNLNPQTSIVSVDVSNKFETKHACGILMDRYSLLRDHIRFSFLQSDSAKLIYSEYWDFLSNYDFDLAFIDGGHLEHNVVADIEIALALKIKWLAFDDVLPEFGPGVIPAIQKYPQLKEVMTIGNIALYENTSL